jgi:hypothetical protein
MDRVINNMNTFYFRATEIKTGNTRIVEGFGENRSEAYNNALSRTDPDETLESLKPKIGDVKARECIDNRKKHYINVGYDEAEAEGLAYCDLQENYELDLENE